MHVCNVMHFQSQMFGKLTSARKLKFFAKTKKLRNSGHCLYAAQGIVVLVIFETAVNATIKENFSRKKNAAICAKTLLSSSEYQKICVRLRSVNCD